MKWPNCNSQIIDMILQNEGGFVDNPDDRGGVCKYGITIETLGSWLGRECTRRDIQLMTAATAKQIYLKKYIVSPGFDQLTDIKLRTAMVDYGVLFGPFRATEALQRLVKKRFPSIKVDGKLGTKTLVATEEFNPDILIAGLTEDRIEKHLATVKAHPDQEVFLNGWLARAKRFVE